MMRKCSLPFEKVLEQFTSLQVRSDQERHQAVPQVETPFLKVTLEDNSAFRHDDGAGRRPAICRRCGSSRRPRKRLPPPNRKPR